MLMIFLIGAAMGMYVLIAHSTTPTTTNVMMMVMSGMSFPFLPDVRDYSF
jgi:hypothetical protein